MLYGFIAFLTEAVTIIPMVFLHKRTFVDIPIPHEERVESALLGECEESFRVESEVPESYFLDDTQEVNQNDITGLNDT